MAAMPLFLIGLILPSPHLMYAGIALYSLVAVFQLITLPVEFNASSRALAALDASGRCTSAELKASKKVLSAAALTYVAALASSLLSLLRLIVIANGNNRR
jgi:Zn-dependent membrane protease YugP